jgi:hypothetical protein
MSFKQILKLFWKKLIAVITIFIISVQSLKQSEIIEKFSV